MQQQYMHFGIIDIMLLDQISYLDCFIFLVFLAPQLIIQVGVWSTLFCALRALPFLGHLDLRCMLQRFVLQLPFQFIKERYLTLWQKQSAFVRQATPFQDLVVRCVRYAFARIPARINRVFFSKGVALPFLRFRMLRHGYLHSPIHWRHVNQSGVKGIWIVAQEHERPDIVIYYCHGGGFSMGSPSFYLEFLLTWVSLLQNVGFNNPALFALEYTLVPDATYPTQIQQALAGYEHVLSITGDASRICVGGDSAGGTLILSLLLLLADTAAYAKRRPRLATLISPWVTLVSPKNRNTRSDYLNVESLHLYAKQYVGSKFSINDPLVSPGMCKDLKWWCRATPSAGFLFQYGTEEVFCEEIRDLITLLEKAGSLIEVLEDEGLIHAWPVAALFLCDSTAARQKGLKDIVECTWRCMGGANL